MTAAVDMVKDYTITSKEIRQVAGWIWDNATLLQCPESDNLATKAKFCLQYYVEYRRLNELGNNPKTAAEFKRVYRKLLIKLEPLAILYLPAIKPRLN